MRVYKTGGGLINSAINKLPFEAHLPGYQYCGPGTKLEKRLKRGDPGINPLDAACKRHDIAYEEHKNGAERTQADRILASEAWKRVKSRDAGVGERTAALAVAAAMKTKIGLSKLGGGLKKIRKITKKTAGKKKSSIKKARKKCISTKKCCTFNGLVRHTKMTMKKTQPESADAILNCALGAAKRVAKDPKSKISVPRVIPVPKTGGLLPLVPIFAGLSALGSLAGGTGAIIRAIGAARAAKAEWDKSKRHNKTIEAIAIGRSKQGEGLYLKPFKTGYGLYLHPYPHSKN